MLLDYLPKRPPSLRRELWAWFIKKIKTTLVLFLNLFCPYAPNPIEPKKQYPKSLGKFTAEQRQQCLEIFQRSEYRVDKLEAKADKLSQTISLLAPLFIAGIAYIWKQLPPNASIISTIVAIAGLLFLFLALIASFRANDIKSLQAPGIRAIIDTDQDKVVEYDAERDGYGLLWCAMMNEVTSDLRADFIRAGNILVSMAVILLLILGIASISARGFEITKPASEEALIETSRTLSETNVELRHALDILSQKSSETSTQINNLIHNIQVYQKELQEIQIRLQELEGKKKP